MADYSLTLAVFGLREFHGCMSMVSGCRWGIHGLQEASLSCTSLWELYTSKQGLADALLLAITQPERDLDESTLMFVFGLKMEKSNMWYCNA